ncbi:hypothetical protein NFJ02_41g108000 [Pycnococcus provasolii]
MANAHAPPTSTTAVRYPVHSRRHTRWDPETGTDVEVLRVNRLRPGELLALAETLKSEKCTLHTLDLTKNNLGDDGARALAEALRSDKCTLHTLYFGNNFGRMNDDCFRALKDAQALSRTRRRRRRFRHHGLLRAIVRLLILRKRASEVVFHPKRLRREGVFDAWAHDG